MNSSLRMVRSAFVLLGLLLACTGVSSGADAGKATSTNRQEVLNSVVGTLTTMDALDDTHRITAGDRLSFRIIEDQEDAKTLIVKDSGQVDVPYIGFFSAAGKTCRRLAHEIKKDLEKEYYHRATVIIAVDQFSPSRGRVYLVGAVLSPGAQEVPGDEVFTVGKAVMRAGGFAPFADKRRVRITRKDGTFENGSDAIVVNVGDILEKGRLDLDVELKPGDMVFVRERSLNF